VVNPLRHVRAIAGAAAFLAALTGCADHEACAGVGVVSQVGVYFAHEGYGDLTGAFIQLCAQGKCAGHRLENEGISEINLQLPEDVGPDLGTVRLRVTPKGSTKPMIDASTEKKLTFQSDNCDGGAYSGALAYTKEKGLLPSVPKEIGKAWVQQRKAEATAVPTPTASS